MYNVTRATVRARTEAGGNGWFNGRPVNEDEAPALPRAEQVGRADRVDGADRAPAEPERVAVPTPSVSSRDDAEVPRELRIAAAYSWRLIVIAAAAVGVLYVVGRLSAVIIPLAIALLLSALLSPAVRFLRKRWNFPPSLASGLVLVGGLGAVIGTLTLVVRQFVSNFDRLTSNAAAGLERIRDWLQTGPLKLSTEQLDNAIAAGQKWVTEHQDTITGGALSTVTATLETLASFFLVLFATFFFMRDGRRIWRFVVRIFPRGAETEVEHAGYASWATLSAYVRATVLVAFIDALGIGIGLYIMDVPLAFPLAALVFLGAFIPIIGSTVSGSVAVLVALVTQGPWEALIVLGIVIGVQQFEGHVLQPLIMGRAVAIHPLAVIVAIAAGVVLAGIVGALVAVPIVAVLNTAVRYLVLKRREPPPDAVIVSADPTP
jgi:predicted PurR-regulated permease PerM